MSVIAIRAIAEEPTMAKRYRNKYVPITPAGTPCFWLSSNTEDEAWLGLLADAAHMPYKTKEKFIKRGYTVEFFHKVPFID